MNNEHILSILLRFKRRKNSNLSFIIYYLVENEE